MLLPRRSSSATGAIRPTPFFVLLVQRAVARRLGTPNSSLVLPPHLWHHPGKIALSPFSHAGQFWCGGETTWFPSSDIEFTRDLACTHAVLPKFGIFSPQGLHSRLRSGSACSPRGFSWTLWSWASTVQTRSRAPLVTKTELHPIDLASAGVPLRLHAVHTTLQDNSKVTGMDAAHRGIPL